MVRSVYQCEHCKSVLVNLGKETGCPMCGAAPDFLRHIFSLDTDT